MHRRGVAACVVAGLAAVVFVVAPGENDTAASVTLDGPAPRPGPAVLYAPPPAAPQLENRSPWFRAAPTLVSGTEAYEDGEYLYQDHLYDDFGSDTGGADPIGDASVGDVDYPTEWSRYGGNAADLVEFRISARREAVAYRFTLNTLLASDSTILTVAFDTDGRPDTGSDRLPRDPGAPFPGTDEVITTWGTGAEHSRFSPESLRPVTTPVEVTADLEANQLTVVVPRTVSDPKGTWRATLAVGLFDPPSGGWLRPQASASPSRPGGATDADPAPSGIFNLAFRTSEPVALKDAPPDAAQAAALAGNQPTRFAHEIDFDALAAGVDRSTVLEHGTQIRIFPSRLQLGEGRDPKRFPRYLGQLQPYSLTIPSTYRRGELSPITLNLHSLTRHHWQYHGTAGLAQLSDERGSLVLTPLARGADGWYQHEAEYDVFEAWGDAARNFDVDMDRVAIAGYSMGGYGTYRLVSLYPDLFGRAMTVAAPPGEGAWLPPAPPSGGRDTLTNPWLASVRHVPLLNAVAGADLLVPVVGPRAQNLGAPEVGVFGLDQLGYRYRFVVYGPADHGTLAGLGYDIPMAADFLGAGRVERDPAHVTFVRAPAADDAPLGLIHDHAYWVSGLTVAGRAETGLIDAVSHALGTGDPRSRAGSDLGQRPLPYLEVNRSWGAAPETAKENRLTVTLTNLASARLDLEPAGLDPGQALEVAVTANVSGVLFLAGSFPDRSAIRSGGETVAGAVFSPAGLLVPVTPGTHRFTIDR